MSPSRGSVALTQKMRLVLWQSSGTLPTNTADVAAWIRDNLVLDAVMVAAARVDQSVGGYAPTATRRLG